MKESTYRSNNNYYFNGKAVFSEFAFLQECLKRACKAPFANG